MLILFKRNHGPPFAIGIIEQITTNCIEQRYAGIPLTVSFKIPGKTLLHGICSQMIVTTSAQKIPEKSIFIVVIKLSENIHLVYTTFYTACGYVFFLNKRKIKIYCNHFLLRRFTDKGSRACRLGQPKGQSILFTHSLRE